MEFGILFNKWNFELLLPEFQNGFYVSTTFTSIFRIEKYHLRFLFQYPQTNSSTRIGDLSTKIHTDMKINRSLAFFFSLILLFQSTQIEFLSMQV